jgi:hypothetical protein
MGVPCAVMPRMDGYGVSAESWEPLALVVGGRSARRYRNSWIVTATAAGRPHALLVWAVWDDREHRLAFSCARGSRTARNLRANAQVTAAGDDTVECLSLEGRATELVPGDRHDMWIERYLATYRPLEDSLSGDFLRANACFEVVPHQAFALIERADAFSTRPTKWVFSPDSSG